MLKGQMKKSKEGPPQDLPPLCLLERSKLDCRLGTTNASIRRPKFQWGGGGERENIFKLESVCPE